MRGPSASSTNVSALDPKTQLQEIHASRVDPYPGLIAALIVFCIYGGIAVSVDFPRAAMGFQSDEATYYMMGQSLARDGDLTYRREDLVRVWSEFPSGPSGVFLKRGSKTQLKIDADPPFVHMLLKPDPDDTRLFYGKSFAYPLVAAPFVRVMGTNGFLFLNAILLALVTLVAYMFLNARSGPVVAVLLATGFVMTSVASVYFVWLTPEIFNLATVTLGYFCWLYKEVAAPGRVPRGFRWLLTGSSDVAGALLLALATFSKPTNGLLILPLMFWFVWKRRWLQTFVVGGLFAVVVAGLFAVNIATSGEWNYQGGERVTCYAAYPFQTPASGLDVCMDRATNRLLTEVIFGPDFWTVLTHNLGYFFVGRYSGLLPYFFPAVFALLALSFRFRRAASWQLLVLAVAAVEILQVLITIPYNYFGGGGVVGNRYFMNTYGLFLFLIPSIESTLTALLPWVIGGLFTAQLTLNPFFASFYPAEHAKRGPLRLLPVELTLVNDLPINTAQSRVRVLFGESLRFQIYFLDDNAYPREENWFWVRGASTAEFLVKTDRPVRHLALSLSGGDVATTATVSVGRTRRSVEITPGRMIRVSLPLDAGFPYQGTRVWHAAVHSSNGFVPMFTSGGTDHRFLGVRVTPELVQ